MGLREQVSAQLREYHAERRERERRVKEAMSALVLDEVRARWAEGVIPPMEGGRFFRDLATRWSCTEAFIADLAAIAGCWPWTEEDVLMAYREQADAKREYWRPEFRDPEEGPATRKRREAGSSVQLRLI
jgi:hypothetical protein